MKLAQPHLVTQLITQGIAYCSITLLSARKHVTPLVKIDLKI